MTLPAEPVAPYKLTSNSDPAYNTWVAAIVPYATLDEALAAAFEYLRTMPSASLTVRDAAGAPQATVALTWH